VQCAACQRENPPEARFCGGCGAALSRSCPACAASNPPDDAFCGRCGARLEAGGPASENAPASAAAAAAEAEHRQLTVMFCDLVESTKLASRLGPEA